MVPTAGLAHTTSVAPARVAWQRLITRTPPTRRSTRYNARSARPPAARPPAPSATHRTTDRRTRSPSHHPPAAARRQGTRYFEYTCCDGDYDYGARGAPEGDECGDYNPDHAVGAAIIGFVFVLVVICGLACGITGCCYGCPGCPWYPSWVEINGLVSLCSSFGQLALRRIRSAPDHASGRPRLRP